MRGPFLPLMDINISHHMVATKVKENKNASILQKM